MDARRAKYAAEAHNGCAAKMELALETIGGRWKMMILAHLSGEEVMRFSDLERAIPKVSQKMLAKQLRALEAADLIQRTVAAEVPPRVEYRLTDLGWTLEPVLVALLEWGSALSDRTE